VRDIALRLAGIAGLVLVGLLAALVLGAIVRRAGRRSGLLSRLDRRTRQPFRTLVAAVALSIGIAAFAPDGRWNPAGHAATLAVIAAAAWLLTALLFVLEDSALPRLKVDVLDNRHARTVRTQLIVLRRVTVVAVAVLAVGAALMTFQDVRVIGTSVLASAGVIAAIAAFATNTLLGNVVAGVQIAFSGSLRLDDVVVVEGEWGRVEEITLTYVVLRLWDERRLIVPSSYFTTKPFENWTHTTSQLTGVVLVEVDHGVAMADLRARLKSIVDNDDRWDGRVCTTQVIDATGGRVTVRALVSAQDAPTLWELRCAVREQLVAWVYADGAEPRTWIASADPGRGTLRPQHVHVEEDGRLDPELRPGLLGEPGEERSRVEPRPTETLGVLGVRGQRGDPAP
jgi:small-conductance mechanosensitive channel